MSRGRAVAPWALLLVVLAFGLWLGSRGPAARPSLDQRTRAIASEIRCPSCEDLSAAESNSEGAVAVRSLIRSDLREGRSKTAIESYLVGRYGPDIILRPSGHGLTSLVWVLPAAAALLAGSGVLLALRRWRPGGGSAPPPDEEDRLLVERALRGEP